MDGHNSVDPRDSILRQYILLELKIMLLRPPQCLDGHLLMATLALST
jgi:hypothetical protein